MALRPNSLTVPPTPQVELEACTRHSIVDRQKLVAELDRIRRHGVAISNQEQFLGIIDVALPVVGLHGPVAAIARSYPIQSPVDSSALAIHREIAFAASAAVRRCQTSH